MTARRQQLLQDLQLAGFAERTCRACVRAGFRDEMARGGRSPERVGLTEGLGRRFVLRPIALVIGRQAVAKVLPCFLLDR